MYVNMTKTCQRCGTRYSSELNVCPVCGTASSVFPQTAGASSACSSPVSPVSAPVAPQSPYTSAPVSTPVQSPIHRPNYTRRRPKVGVIVAVALVLIVLINDLSTKRVLSQFEDNDDASAQQEETYPAPTTFEPEMEITSVDVTTLTPFSSSGSINYEYALTDNCGNTYKSGFRSCMSYEDFGEQSLTYYVGGEYSELRAVAFARAEDSGYDGTGYIYVYDGESNELLYQNTTDKTTLPYEISVSLVGVKLVRIELYNANSNWWGSSFQACIGNVTLEK